MIMVLGRFQEIVDVVLNFCTFTCLHSYIVIGFPSNFMVETIGSLGGRDMVRS